MKRHNNNSPRATYKGLIVFLTIVFLASIHSLCIAQAHNEIMGYVFVDVNNNNVKDTNERGVKGVAVSDQVNVVVTDDNGKYTIDRPSGNGFVFISVPSGFKTTQNFWQKIDLIKSSARVDFALVKTPEVNSFTFIHASDSHISEKSVNRFQLFKTKTDSIKPDFVIITGDLVKDALRVSEVEASGYYKLFEQESQKITAPVWTVPGNHEIFGIERHLSLVAKNHPLYGRKMYHSFFGPDYYSFNYGGIHFVGLNSLEFDDLWYYGSIDSIQVEWLKRDLEKLAPQTPVVTFQHVPFYTGGLSLEPFEEAGLSRTLEREDGALKYRHVVSNAQEVISILVKHSYPLALAGHYHFMQRFYFKMLGQQIRFEQTGAIIAPAESGLFKMPSGFIIYKVKNGTIDEGTFVQLPN